MVDVGVRRKRARRRMRKRKDANWEVGVPRGDDDESVECGGV
jgi:hypothetical protein